MGVLNLSAAEAIAAVAVLWVTSILLGAVYNVYFHPLREYPGPLLMRASRLPYIYYNCSGRSPHLLLELHNKYGSVVRFGPNELAFADPAAWNDIQGHRAKGQAELEKSETFYRPVKGIETDIVNAGRDEHSLLRRTLAHGFSEKSLRDQEPLIEKYVDLLIRRLKEKGEGGRKALDMTAWFNFTTFDIIGDLAFGESFGCLDKSQYHEWVWTIFQTARIGTFFQAMAGITSIKFVLDILIPVLAKLDKSRAAFKAMAESKLQTRMDKYKDRPDLVEPMLKRADEWGLTMDKLIANCSILIVGGSETTATLLSGAAYYLTMNPDALQKATAEVRLAFQSERDIDFVSVNKLTYLIACLSEALRLYPPVGMGLPRVVPRGGSKICGKFVPESTVVSVHHFAMYRQASLFKDPLKYCPERFLGDPQYQDDVRDALQPFHVGPRNCVGRNLAYVEMRTIMARVLWNFDLKIAPESVDWADQKNFNVWDKGPLMVHLSPRAG